jgi:uncharacterized protein (TIGR02145 family)
MKKTIFLFFSMFLMMACTINEDEEFVDYLKTSGEFIDSRDHHEYQWVKIGKQIWMAENLAYLPSVSPLINDTANLPCYYVYGYDGTDVNMAKSNLNYIKYGVLYDWSAALTACPAGWHLPSDAEWQQLEIELGMTTYLADECVDFFDRGTDQGNQLKTASGWNNDGNGTNSSGFSGLPGGYRFGNGNFCFIGKLSYCWSSTDSSEDLAWGRGLAYNSSGVCRSRYYKENGFSVRCIKD